MSGDGAAAATAGDAAGAEAAAAVAASLSAAATTATAGGPSADDLRRAGNEHFVAKRYAEAAEVYSQAIAKDPVDHLLYGNRSAAYHAIGRFDEALSDANMAVRISPRWLKGYHRQGAALASLGRERAAATAYGEAMRVERPAPAWVKEQHAKWTAAADAADRERAVTSVDGWMAVFRHIRDIRLRLACLAHFWNDAGKPVRFAVFKKFFELVSPSGEAGSAEVVSRFDAEQMRELPLDNYADITLPAPWLAFFHDAGAETQPEVFARMWTECTSQEQELIMKDISFFFTHANGEGEGEGEGEGAGGAGEAGAVAPPAAPTASGGAGSGGKKAKRRRNKKGKGGDSAGGGAAAAGAAAAAVSAPAARAGVKDDVGAGGGAPPGTGGR